MRDGVRERYLKAQELIVGGMTIAEACKRVHMGRATYLKFKNGEEVTVKTHDSDPKPIKRVKGGGKLVVIVSSDAEKLARLISQL